MLEKFKSLNLAPDPQKIIGSLSDPEITWLMSLIADNGVQRSLESGLGNGYSAAASLLAGVVQHTSIEMSPRNVQVAQSNISKAKGPGQYFRLLMGYSDVRLAELVQRGEKFDLILVDGGHSFEDAFIDIHYARALLDAGGLLLIDDTIWPSVNAAINWHATHLAKVWQKIEPPDSIKAQSTFHMATFRRTDVYVGSSPIPPPMRSPTK